MLPFPTRAPMAITGLAVTALFALPLLTLSLYAVRWRRAYRFHKFLQTGLAVFLLTALLAFEWQIRGEGWRLFAADSPYFDTWVMPALLLHLFWAGPCLGLWTLTLFGAWKKFPVPTKPGEYSMIHKRMGRFAALAIFGTTITGWLFYWLAFVC